jgi:hypothetical protein
VAPAPELDQQVGGRPDVGLDATADEDTGERLGGRQQLGALELGREIERRHGGQASLVERRPDNGRQVDRLERRQLELECQRFGRVRQPDADGERPFELECLGRRLCRQRRHRVGAPDPAGRCTVAVVSSGVALPWIAAIAAGVAMRSSGR